MVNNVFHCFSFLGWILIVGYIVIGNKIGNRFHLFLVFYRKDSHHPPGVRIGSDVVVEPDAVGRKGWMGLGESLPEIDVD